MLYPHYSTYIRSCKLFIEQTILNRPFRSQEPKLIGKICFIQNRSEGTLIYLALIRPKSVGDTYDDLKVN